MADRFGYGEIGLDIHPCRGCEDYDESDGCKSNGGGGKPITNADKIRAMTDEELVEFFCDMIQDCGCNNVPCQKFCATKKTCEQAWLDWLKQEAKE